jgi:SAM-dependent methyltransferase
MKTKQLPEAEIHELGLRYWPYALSQQAVLEEVVRLAPPNGRLLDIMCGPGNLLGRIANIRPDLKLTGVDKKPQYVQYLAKTYPEIISVWGDVLHWHPATPFDIVICTGSLHHLPYNLQEKAIASIASMVKPGKPVILSDCYIDDYSDEVERKKAAEKLGHEYMQATIQNGAPDDVLAWTMDITWNDVFQKEYKTSIVKRLPLLEKRFCKVETIKTWPAGDMEYGDYIHICLGQN